MALLFISMSHWSIFFRIIAWQMSAQNKGQALLRFFLESTLKDQINPKRQTAGPPEGGSPELDLASYRLSPLRLSQTLRQSHY